MQDAEIPVVFLVCTQQPFSNCIIGMPEGVIYRPSVTILCGDCDVDLGQFPELIFRFLNSILETARTRGLWG